MKLGFQESFVLFQANAGEGNRAAFHSHALNIYSFSGPQLLLNPISQKQHFADFCSIIYPVRFATLVTSFLIPNILGIS